MREAGLEEVEEYKTRRQNMFEQYIAMWPTLDLCGAAVWRKGTRVSKRWWEQEGLDLEGAQSAAEAV